MDNSWLWLAVIGVGQLIYLSWLLYSALLGEEWARDTLAAMSFAQGPNTVSEWLLPDPPIPGCGIDRPVAGVLLA